MTVEGVDYAWDRPTVAGLVSAGKRFVVRYGGPGSAGKQLDAVEARALIATGFALVANAEGTANGLVGGRAVGAAWARDADQHFRALGMPADRPIYLSVDFDAGSDHWPAIDAALRGAAEVLGAGRVGVYGGYDTIAHCAAAGTARWFWQTYGWSGGRWHDRAHIRQYRNHVPLAGGTVDLCRAMVADYGQWGQPRGMDDDMPVTDAEMDEIAQRAARAVHDQRIGKSTVTIGQLLQSLPAALAAEGTSAGELAAALGALPQPAPVDVDGLAAALTERLKVALPAGSPVTDEQLERVLRSALGSLDNAQG